MKLTDNLYAYVWKGNDNNCNSYIYANVLSNDKHIIIDPGYTVTPYTGEKAYEILVKQINQDGLKVEDIGVIMITHAHPDHIDATIKFKENSHALVAIYKDEQPMYKALGGDAADILLEVGELKKNKMVQAELEIYHTPGHSPGEICIYWPERKALAVGDVIFYRNTGRVDLPGGDPGLLMNSIEKISKLDVEYLLCGHPYGHPGVIKGKEAIKQNFQFVLDNICF